MVILRNTKKGMKMDIQKLFKLAAKYEKLAYEVTSATPVDIEKVLQDARVWELQTGVAPLLNQAGVSQGTSVSVSIVVGNRMETNFIVELNPPNPQVSKKLSMLIHQKYANVLSKALLDAGVKVQNVVVVKWLSF
jgi:hypothetical protein